LHHAAELGHARRIELVATIDPQRVEAGPALDLRARLAGTRPWIEARSEPDERETALSGLEVFCLRRFSESHAGSRVDQAQ
jgi:hypothetical protein